MAIVAGLAITFTTAASASAQSVWDGAHDTTGTSADATFDTAVNWAGDAVPVVDRHTALIFGKVPGGRLTGDVISDRTISAWTFQDHDLAAPACQSFVLGNALLEFSESSSAAHPPITMSATQNRRVQWETPPKTNPTST